MTQTPLTPAAMATLRAAFDAGYYAAMYPDIVATGDVDALITHYVTVGADMGFDPHPNFCTRFYAALPGVAQARMNPYLHYLTAGREDGRPSAPDRMAQMRALFDADHYATLRPDVAQQGMDPFEHYLARGWKERLDPHPDLDAAFYEDTNRPPEGMSPLEHYVRAGQVRGLKTHPYRAIHGYSVHDDMRRFSNPGPDFEDRDPNVLGGRTPRAKAVALYLPQFHAFPENDAWWGTGFTEWRNVSRGIPRFEGHYQPRIPQELGHYDLEQSPGMLARQVDMARAAGLGGFCFYYYWFDGKRVLDRPLDRFAGDTSLDFPFMLLWANENWTKRWDGFDANVLLAQSYDEAQEHAMLADWCRYFADPRYIRIQGRPLFVLYRPGIVPNAARTIARWRTRLRDEFGVEPWMFMTQGFNDTDPRLYGLDGAMEFPPHKLAYGLPEITDAQHITDPRFTGRIIDYGAVVQAAKAEPVPDYPLMRGVMPSWDNDVRRQGKGGTTYHGSTPEAYEDWLGHAADWARDHPFEGESLVFVNAWNEWAEAAYLEPDVHYGAAYLNATGRALSTRGMARGGDKVTLVSHDAHPHGAQMLVLHLARVLTTRFGVDVAIVVLGDGPLLERYRATAPTYAVGSDAQALSVLAQALAADGHRGAIVNTTVSGRALAALKHAGMTCISLIHELPRLIAEYGLEPAAKTIAREAHRIVFPAPQVQAGFEAITGPLGDRALIRPQGSYLPWTPDAQESAALRARLGIGPADKLVLNAGYADMRKGVDLFLATARAVTATRDDVHFVWAGKLTPDAETWLMQDVDPASRLGQRLHVLGFVPDPVPVFGAADLFYLSSREDPFPTVVLEALRAGLPVVGFEGSGGSVDLIDTHGTLVPRGDAQAAATAITTLLDAPDEAASQARTCLIETEFQFDAYAHDLLTLLRPGLPRISAVVPNYAYADHLPARLDTVFGQTHPLFEVIVLDDASPDDSLDVLDTYRARTGADFDLHVNAQNAGSGYAQWDRGAGLARGDLVWIAEADDLSDPHFLTACAEALADPNVAFVFTDSAQVDGSGTPLAPSYGYYFDTVDPDAFRADFTMDGTAFARRFLSVKNLILNVSGVLWRRDALLDALEATRAGFKDNRVASDWRIYAHAATRPGAKVAYVARSLNTHRRHADSVTHARNQQAHYDEITRAQDAVADMLDGLDADTQARRDAYRAELRAQFGLDATP